MHCEPAACAWDLWRRLPELPQTRRTFPPPRNLLPTTLRPALLRTRCLLAKASRPRGGGGSRTRGLADVMVGVDAAGWDGGQRAGPCAQGAEIMNDLG